MSRHHVRDLDLLYVYYEFTLTVTAKVRIIAPDVDWMYWCEQRV